MLAIRLQRQGKKGYPVYRIIVQEKQLAPTSGRVVAYVGNYNPHTKAVVIKAEIAQKYLDHGAEPTTRVAKLLQENGVKLPEWVKLFDGKRQGKTRFEDKLRKNQPKEEAAPDAPETESGEKPETEAAAPVEAPESSEEVVAPETPAEQPAEGGENEQ